MSENTKETKPKSAVALREEEILSFWKEKQIFEKTLKQTEGGKEFVFYDGPPFATGLPHFGHILPGTMKDVIPRFKTMQGYHVRRQWGWDCHGLPIENLIEKELGLKSKKDILDLGIDKFNDAARASVMRYADDWKRIIPRTGRFVNMDRDYKTMDSSYTESVWWSFKTMYDKGLVYEGFKSMHLCPRCETTLSNFEVNQGYKDITDISVYAKFELVDEPGTFFLAWTTTPWTLPGNVALAVNPEVEYVKIQVGEGATAQKIILAKPRLAVVKEQYSILEEIAGAKLIGKKYKPVFSYYVDKKLDNKDNAWKVYGAAFVTTEDGTGIVHIAPAFGSDDMELAQQNNIPFIQHVSPDGKFKPEVTDFAGQAVKPKATEEDAQGHQKADIEIIKNLAHRGLLFAKEKLVHSYPHCWRCDTPLLNYATSSWFIKVTALKADLLKANSKVNWIPGNLKDGRFGKWLEGAKDWAVSRSRFWGAPLPVWKCEKCEKAEVFGSTEDLRKKIPQKNTYFVMRHGESESTAGGFIGNDPNKHGLTENGKKRVELSAQKLKGQGIELVFVSPYLRTQQSAEIVARVLGLNKNQVITEPTIHEIKTGIFNEKPVSEYHNYFASYEERLDKRPPGGECQIDIKKRMGDFISRIDKQYSGKKILIITHDTPAWLLFAAAGGLTRQQTLKLHDGIKNFLLTAEVRELPFVQYPHTSEYEFEFHRPHIDGVEYSCACGGTMKRVPEVFDTWYDSGSMPFAQNHYPFENLSIFNPKSIAFLKDSKGFPADFIAEGLDQTRGWFYTLMVLSVALFGKAPYKNVLVNGLVLAEDGRKMSKRLKNYPELMDTVDKYSADALRYFLMSSPAVHAEDVNFSEKGVDEVQKKLIMRLQNVVSFYEMYASKDVDPAGALQSPNVLDKWILARLSEVRDQMTEHLEKYEIDRASWPLDGFIDDLSTWYLRRSRDRFKGDDVSDKKFALSTTRFVLREFAKVMAPIMPFTADDIFLKIKTDSDPESVHLAEWPEKRKASGQIIEQMAEVRKAVTLGLEARMKANSKVRQPLQRLTLQSKTLEGQPNLIDLVKDEVNVKEVVIDPKIDAPVNLDTTLTPELKQEGQYRELVRMIQDLRKKEKLNPSDIVTLTVEANDAAKVLIAEYKVEITKTTQLKDIVFTELGGEQTKIDDLMVVLKIQK